MCSSACGGTFTGKFCYTGKGGSSSGSDGSGGGSGGSGGGCIQDESHCDFSEDCCSGFCFTGDYTCRPGGFCHGFGDPCTFDEDCCGNYCGDDGTCE
jgi:hypothetical protein